MYYIDMVMTGEKKVERGVARGVPFGVLDHSTGKPRGCVGVRVLASGWDSGRTKLPNPRAPPMPSDAEYGRGPADADKQDPLPMRALPRLAGFSLIT